MAFSVQAAVLVPGDDDAIFPRSRDLGRSAGAASYRRKGIPAMACSTSTFSIGGSQPLGAMSARKLDFRNHRRSVNFDVDREGKHSAAGMRWCRMTQPFVVYRSPFRRRLARAATAVAVVCWLASIGLLIWAMRLDHAHFDDFSRFWEHVIRRNRFPIGS